MPTLRFSCTGAEADIYAAGPTINLHMQLNEDTGVRMHSVALRCQLRIEPRKRGYTDAEAAKAVDLFGERSRWAETMNPMQLGEVAVMVPTFRYEVTVPVPVPLTYDVDIAASKYLNALGDGPDSTVPLLILFSGSAFYTPVEPGVGVQIAQVPWHEEAMFRLPVSVWRAAMESHFGNTGWIRLRCESLDTLLSYRSVHGIPSWEQTFEQLLKEASFEGGATDD